MNAPNPASVAAIACADSVMGPAACCSLLSVDAQLQGCRLFLLGMDMDDAYQRGVEAFMRKHDIVIEVLLYALSRAKPVEGGRWSPATLARLDLDSHVPRDVQRLLYLDADALALSPLAGLIGVDLEGKALGAVGDYLMAFPDKLDQRLARIGLEPGAPYFNAGVALFDWQATLARGRLRQAREAFEANSERYFALDQDVLNVAFAGDWLELEPRWNVQTGFLPFVPDPGIVHFTGRRKPWQTSTNWVHRPMRAFYREALAGTPWADFSRSSSMFEAVRSYTSAMGSNLASGSRTHAVRAYVKTRANRIK